MKRIHIIIVLFLSAIAFSFTNSSNAWQLLLTDGTAKVWNLTHVLVNEYEMTKSGKNCTSKIMRLKFILEDNTIMQDTSCNKTGAFVLPFTYSIKNDSIFMMNRAYMIEQMTSSKMILSYTKNTVVYQGDVPKDTTVATFKLLFEAE